MVRVPESSGDSGFHQSQEDVKVKEEYREGVPTNAGQTWIEIPDLEENPRIPLKTAPAVTAALDENPDPHTTDKDTTKSKSNLSTKSAPSTRSSRKKKIKAARTKLKAPDSESEDVHKPRSTIAKDMIELNAVKILLDLIQEAGLVAGEIDPDSLFEMELGAIQAATQDLYESLKILVGEHVQMPDLSYQTGSSHYASATSEPDSDSPRAPQRMSLGPSGAKYMRSRVNRQDQRPAGPSRTSEKPNQQENRQIPAGRVTPVADSTGSSNKLGEYFQMAMNRFLKEQNLMTVRISAISDLKEFTGKDMDEDRARAWIGKVKSAFQRDQATEEEKCLTFGDLVVGSTKN
ncbi:hypothetical protein PHMEG_00015695 [Phytophthora megakarya]|uniref:Eukaryotic/viral aspartic protease n=1 Tax=Phytophthora megakarya TaxID=4795 RepID=A0A225W369_9STRA|nr:hypothetical protein PHMEG_00015695 [Phytophthora megakarya]